jgi:hypothetical protein
MEGKGEKRKADALQSTSPTSSRPGPPKRVHIKPESLEDDPSGARPDDRSVELQRLQAEMQKQEQSHCKDVLKYVNHKWQQVWNSSPCLFLRVPCMFQIKNTKLNFFSKKIQ